MSDETRPQEVPQMEPRNHRIRSAGVVFYSVLLIGAIYRIWLSSTPYLQPGSDQGVVYLMAVHAAHGEVTAFFWGQGYGGSLLSLVAGAAMVVTGAHFETLVVVSVLFWAAAAWFLRGIVAAGLGAPAGDVAGILFWLPGVALLDQSIGDPGFYGTSLALGLAATWLLVRTPGGKPWWQWLVAGLLVGLAFWQSPIGAAIAAPAILLQVWRQRSWRLALLGAAAVIAGAAPWLTAALTRGVRGAASHDPGVLAVNVRSFFTHVVPAAFWLGQESAAFRLPVAALVLALFVLLAVYGVTRRNPVVLVIVAGGILAYLVIVLAAPSSLARASRRYTAFELPVIVAGLALILTRWRRCATVGVVLGLLLGLAITVPPTAHTAATRIQAGQGRWHAGDAQTIAYLEKHRMTAGYADYWQAYRLDAASDGRLRLAGIQPDRYPAYTAAARAQRRTVVVVTPGQSTDMTLRRTAAHVPHRRLVFGGNAVWVFDGRFTGAPLAAHSN